MKRLIVAILLAGTFILAGATIVNSLTAAPKAPSAGGTTSTSVTIRETLCIEGYLPDGRWFECP